MSGRRSRLAWVPAACEFCSVVPGGAGEVAVAQAVAVAFEGDDLGVVDEAVDHGGGDDVVAEISPQPLKGLLLVTIIIEGRS
jgi:hypothetical protein